MIGVRSQVVCIEDYTKERYSEYREYGVKFPVKGVVYTVRDIISFGTHGTGIRLDEIINQPMEWWGTGYMEITFRIEHFRPVQPRNIDCFTEILERVKNSQFTETPVDQPVEL